MTDSTQQAPLAKPATSSIRDRLRTSYKTAGAWKPSGGQLSQSAQIQSQQSQPQSQPQTVTQFQPLPQSQVQDFVEPVVSVEDQISLADAILSEVEQAKPVEEKQLPEQLLEQQPEPLLPSQPVTQLQTQNQPQSQTVPQPHFTHTGVPAGMVAQAIPQALDQATRQANMQYQPGAPTTTFKESNQQAGAVDSLQADVGAGVQVIEHEHSPEIPPEVESFIQKAESHADQLPQEISIAGDQIALTPVYLPKKSVVVLPISEQLEKQGAKKSTSWSLRWLVEWSRKLMKIFNGEIIYRE